MADVLMGIGLLVAIALAGACLMFTVCLAFYLARTIDWWLSIALFHREYRLKKLLTVCDYLIRRIDQDLSDEPFEPGSRHYKAVYLAMRERTGHKWSYKTADPTIDAPTPGGK